MKTQEPQEPESVTAALSACKKCSGCKQEIDPSVCWCGDPRPGHGYQCNHPFIPMGCDCFRDPRNDEA